MQLSGSLGDRIASLRAKNRISQKELADYLYVNQGTVSRWEKGIRFPDKESMLRMAGLFKVDPDILLSAPLDGAPAVMVLDDEPEILESSTELIRQALPDAEVFSFSGSEKALLLLRKRRVQVAFVDIRMADENGLSVAEKLLQVQPQMNIIFLTNHPEHMKSAFRMHASGYILKPADLSDFEDEISHLRYPL